MYPLQAQHSIINQWQKVLKYCNDFKMFQKIILSPKIAKQLCDLPLLFWPHHLYTSFTPRNFTTGSINQVAAAEPEYMLGLLPPSQKSYIKDKWHVHYHCHTKIEGNEIQIWPSNASGFLLNYSVNPLFFFIRDDCSEIKP